LYVSFVCDLILVLLYVACLDVAAARCSAKTEHPVERESVSVFCTSLFVYMGLYTIGRLIHSNRPSLICGVCDSFICVYCNLLRFYVYTWSMGWLRLVGSLKLQVSFAKEPYKRDDILQKRPYVHMWSMGWLRLVGSFKL